MKNQDKINDVFAGGCNLLSSSASFKSGVECKSEEMGKDLLSSKPGLHPKDDPVLQQLE